MSEDQSPQAEPALRFATSVRPGILSRWSRGLRVLAGAPRETAAILRARMTGRRVRARQALAALLGLDHHGLWRPPLRLDEGRPLHRNPRNGDGIRILDAPGHTLLPGAEARLRAAFAGHPERQVLYGDALLVGPDGTVMPLLRPAFDPDYLMAVDYIGPVLGVRASAIDAVATPEEPTAIPAIDLILRIADRFGAGAIGHLPYPLSHSAIGMGGHAIPAKAARYGPPDAGDWPGAVPGRPEAPAGEGALRAPPDCTAARRAIVVATLARSGQADVAVIPGRDGIFTLRRPLPSEPPLVSLIVPTRDRLDLLRACIASLVERTDWPACEILICDNDSVEPETHAYFQDLTARGLARIVPCPGPFDFAGMNNAAARSARGRVLAFVNNDVEAIHPDWLDRMVREALRPEIGAVGAKLLDRAGRIQHGGVLLGPGGLVTHAHRFFSGEAPGYLAGLLATRAVAAVTAACLVVDAGKFARVGGFDETFAVDFNDVDLCLRLGAAGYRTLFVPGAVLNHYEAASRRWSPATLARHRDEVAAFKKRWGPLLAQDPHYHPGFDPHLGSYARLHSGWPGTGPLSPR